MKDEPGMPGVVVDVPLPPECCRCWGYRGDARFVSFRVDAGLDEAVFDDGRWSGSAEAWAYQSWRRHQAVFPLLGDALVSPPGQPQRCLLIDRAAHRARIVPVAECRAFLKGQWPPEPHLTEAQREAVERELDRLAEESRRSGPVDMAQVLRAMKEQQGRISRMASWLDMCPVPPQRERS
jgi:hypothetical protein